MIAGELVVEAVGFGAVAEQSERRLARLHRKRLLQRRQQRLLEQRAAYLYDAVTHRGNLVAIPPWRPASPSTPGEREEPQSHAGVWAGPRCTYRRQPDSAGG